MIHMKRLLPALAMLILVITSNLSHGAAATSSKPLITVAPFLQAVRLELADNAKSFRINFTNGSQSTQVLLLSAVDFGSLDETGGVIFAGTNESALLKKYGL